MVTMHSQQMYADLREFLFEPFRSAFIHRLHNSTFSSTPTDIVESVARVYLFELSATSDRIKEIVDKNAMEEARLRAPPHSVYEPEALKKMVEKVGWEAWKHRYDGPIEIELKVRQSKVALQRIGHPHNTFTIHG